VSQIVTIEVGVVGLAQLISVLAELGLEHARQKKFQAESGQTHDVDLVITDEEGTQVGVKVDERTGQATFTAHDGKDARGTAVVQRIAQRSAYSRVIAELKRKGYQLEKEERKKDGTIEIVAQRWR